MATGAGFNYSQIIASLQKRVSTQQQTINEHEDRIARLELLLAEPHNRGAPAEPATPEALNPFDENTAFDDANNAPPGNSLFSNGSAPSGTYQGAPARPSGYGALNGRNNALERQESH